MPSRPSPQQNRPRHVKQTPAFPTRTPKQGYGRRTSKRRRRSRSPRWPAREIADDGLRGRARLSAIPHSSAPLPATSDISSGDLMCLGNIETCCDNLCVGSCHRLLARPLIYLIFLAALQQHRLVLSLHIRRIDVSNDFVFVACGPAPIDAGHPYDLCSEFLMGDRLTNELS